MVKLLFYISTLDGGGAEKVLVNLLKQLDEKKYDITLVTLRDSGAHVQSLPRYVKYYPIIKSTNLCIRKILSVFLYRVIPTKIFHRLFLHGDYDIEIAYLTGIPTKIIQHSTNKKSKKVCFIHGNVSDGETFTKVYGSIDKAIKLYSKMDRVCFVSHANLNAYVKLCGDTKNLCVIRNVLDLEEIYSKAEKNVDTGYFANSINIISVGRFAEEKGYRRLIKVFSRLKASLKTDTYTLTLLGTGPQEMELRSAIEEDGLTNVRLIPFQENPFPFVANADLFVCSSYTEGYSTAVSEATLLGTPVITTECDGMREIFDDGVGGRIVENSEEGLYDILQQYLTDEIYRRTLKEEGRVKKQMYKQKCSENIRIYERFFEEILDVKQ